MLNIHGTGLHPIKRPYSGAQIAEAENHSDRLCWVGQLCWRISIAICLANLANSLIFLEAALRDLGSDTADLRATGLPAAFAPRFATLVDSSSAGK